MTSICKIPKVQNSKSFSPRERLLWPPHQSMEAGFAASGETGETFRCDTAEKKSEDTKQQQ